MLCLWCLARELGYICISIYVFIYKTKHVTSDACTSDICIKFNFIKIKSFDECTKHKQIEKDEVITNSLELRNEIIFTCNQRVVCSKPIEYSSWLLP